LYSVNTIPFDIVIKKNYCTVLLFCCPAIFFNTDAGGGALASKCSSVIILPLDNKSVIEEQVKKHNSRKDNYEKMQQELSAGSEYQVSTSDPDSRQMMTRNNISEVAYNIQTVVDAKHNLPIDYKVTNHNDTRAMSGMLRRTKIILGNGSFTALYDKGYHTGAEIKKAVEMNVHIMVAIPKVASAAPDEKYNYAYFKYDQVIDTYTCP
jgi:Transposase DDE domain